jgi:hypothetical protein
MVQRPFQPRPALLRTQLHLPGHRASKAQCLIRIAGVDQAGQGGAQIGLFGRDALRQPTISREALGPILERAE